LSLCVKEDFSVGNPHSKIPFKSWVYQIRLGLRGVGIFHTCYCGRFPQELEKWESRKVRGEEAGKRVVLHGVSSPTLG
jgi:hypothetical protein